MTKRLDEKEPVLPFRDMGLEEQKKYLVFEFWTKQFRGIHSKKFEPGALDPKFNCQVFCFREQQNHPQILATNRHISCGGVDLVDVSWEKNTLAGKSEIVPIENYVLYIYEPSSHRYLSVECDNAQVVSSTSNGSMRTIELKPKSNAKTLHWKIHYR